LKLDKPTMDLIEPLHKKRARLNFTVKSRKNIECGIWNKELGSSFEYSLHLLQRNTKRFTANEINGFFICGKMKNAVAVSE